MRGTVLLLGLVVLAGCLRLGGGDDLHLVCEEKSNSPRKTYGIETLVAETQVHADVTDAQKIAILEEARQHLITMGGRPHEGLSASLDAVEGGWLFQAVGVREAAPADEYAVLVQDTAVGPRALDAISPPFSIRKAVERATGVNATEMQAAWDPELPSCVTVVDGTAELTVNVVQERVVLKQ